MKKRQRASNCALPLFVLYWLCGPSPIPLSRKGGGTMSLITFVAAQVIAYYLCMWLDSLIGKGSKH